jgi:hypothetical protein
MNFVICSLPQILGLSNKRGGRWAGPVACTEGLVSGRKSRLKNLKENTNSRPRRRWKDNIEADLKELGRDDMPCIQDRNQRRSAVNSVKHLWML